MRHTIINGNANKNMQATVETAIQTSSSYEPETTLPP